jgi:hypothetical protein
MEHKYYIRWEFLSENPSAIDFLEKNKHRICYCHLSYNPEIFELDYKKMSKKRTSIFEEELMMKALHPSKIESWLQNGFSVDDLF